MNRENSVVNLAVLMTEPRRRPSRGGSVSGEHGGFVRRRSQLPTSPELQSSNGRRTIRTTLQEHQTTPYSERYQTTKVEVKTAASPGPEPGTNSTPWNTTTPPGAETDFLYRSRGYHEKPHVRQMRGGTEAALLPPRSSSHQERPQQSRPEVWVPALNE